jgi:hypothetical protein
VEEAGQTAQDAGELDAARRLRHGFDHGQEVHHDIVLAVPEGVVLEEEQAGREAILYVLDAEDAIGGISQHHSESGEGVRAQLLRAGALHRFGQGQAVLSGQARE